MRILASLIILLTVVLSSGCQKYTIPLEGSSDPSDAPLSTPSPGDGISTPDRINPTVTKLPERVPPTEVTTPVTGEVPTELLQSIIKDLSERIGVATGQIVVTQDQEIVWNDGSLGCAQPGEFYTQAQVNGYWVILDIEGKQYDYRATDRGYFLLCEGRFSPTPPTSTPNS